MIETAALLALGALFGALLTLIGVLLHADITTRRLYRDAVARDAQAVTTFHEKRPGQRLKAIDGGAPTPPRGAR